MSFSEGQFIDEIKDNSIPDVESLKDTVVVDRKTKYQNIWGFGGAITDSATININLLTPPTQYNLLL